MLQGERAWRNHLAAQGMNMNTPTDTLYTLLHSNVTVPLLSAAGNDAAARARRCSSSNSSTSITHFAQTQDSSTTALPPTMLQVCVTLLPPACRNLLRPQHSCIRKHLCTLHPPSPLLPAACLPSHPNPAAAAVDVAAAAATARHTPALAPPAPTQGAGCRGVAAGCWRQEARLLGPAPAAGLRGRLTRCGAP